MDSTISVALIGAVATVTAAAIAAWVARRRRVAETDSKNPHISATAGRDISHSVIGSSNVSLHETRLGPITQINIENFQLAAAIVQPSTRAAQTLVFLTEQAINYKGYETGLALSFSLRNGHHENILVYSITIAMKQFCDSSTTEFRQLLEQLTPPAMFASAPIPVYGAKVQLRSRDQTAEASWGEWDDSAGSRGAALATLDPSQFEKMHSLIKTAGTSAEVRGDSSHELLKPSMRFSQKPGETDSFHFDVTGDEEGLYVFDLTVGYHLGNQKLQVPSDRQYVFMSVDTMTRARH